jgi:hypothetical protein
MCIYLDCLSHSEFAIWIPHGPCIAHGSYQNKVLTYGFQYTHNKGFADDLSEGKFSFPIIHGVRSDDVNHLMTSA